MLTPLAQQHLDRLSELVPGIEPPFLVETALALAVALYEKTRDGNTVQVVDANGRVEELRFRVRKGGRKKG
jgi:hypothetical protein